MLQEVASFVNPGDVSQNPIPRIRNELKCNISTIRLFHAWCTVFARSLPRMNAGDQYLIVTAEQMPANLFNSIGVTEFIEKETIMQFGPPGFTLNDNNLKFDWNWVRNFARRFNIQWKCTSTYNPQFIGIFEHMASTFKKAVKKFTRSAFKGWDVCLANVIYRYKRRPGPDRVVPFEILFGVKSRFAT